MDKIVLAFLDRPSPQEQVSLGRTGPKMMQMGGELADGVLVNRLLSTSYTRSAVEPIATGAASAGHSQRTRMAIIAQRRIRLYGWTTSHTAM